MQLRYDDAGGPRCSDLRSKLRFDQSVADRSAYSAGYLLGCLVRRDYVDAATRWPCAVSDAMSMVQVRRSCGLLALGIVVFELFR